MTEQVTNYETKDEEIKRLTAALAKANAENEQLRGALAAFLNFAAIVQNAAGMLPRVRME